MDMPTNPLLIDWTPPAALPPFDRIQAEHFPAAFALAMQEHQAELQALAGHPAPPDFENTLAAFDRAGERLRQLEAVFHSLAASATSPALQAVQRQMAGPLAAHASRVLQDAAVFARVDAVHQQRDRAGLTPEQLRLCERVHQDFVRAGAQLPPVARLRFAQAAQRLAELNTQFGQNVLHDEAAYLLVLPDEAAQAGLPAAVRAAGRQAAAERGHAAGVCGITLSRSLLLPFLSFSDRRDLREQAWRAWVGRGEQPGPHFNPPLLQEILALRQEQALLLGFNNFADYTLANTMARHRQAVWALLDPVWERAKAVAAEEHARLEALRAELEPQASGPLQAWDWRYWAEKLRQRDYALDDEQVKPYFSLANMVAAAFDCAGRLFGVVFVPRPELQAYHPDVQVHEVRRQADGHSVGLFLHDNFARATKRSGAWMSALTAQHRNGSVQLPVVLNNNNFARAAPGAPVLLSIDDVRTLFHEFGHGLHGLLSDVTYQRLSGTEVLRDFVELPSQLFEHWAQDRGVLRQHARHWQTGEPLPDALIDRIEAAQRFGQGVDTLRYTASAIADMAVHELAEPPADPVAFEAALMAARGLPPAVGMNHRLPHFQHLFAGGGYAAGYYVYLWAEVLDADAFEAFTEAGDVFDPATAARLLRCIYSSGDSIEPGAAYRAFRGRDAGLAPMLRGRGLA